MKLRVVSEPVSFADLACAAFAAVARYGISDHDFVTRLLDVMETCSRGSAESDRDAIMRLRDAIRLESAGLSFKNTVDPKPSVGA